VNARKQIIADTNMANDSIIKLFEGNQVRILWNEAEEKYYFSVVDIVGVLTDSVNPTDYLKKLQALGIIVREGEDFGGIWKRVSK
jgi:hypothetical protein